MGEYSLYGDIAKRTGGDIYIGVVGPARTGKSTFIKRFMETMVLPHMSDDSKRERARDEIPQCGAGKTVMTTEPKFVPEEAVSISFGENTRLNVRMVDCVGYLVPSVLGTVENGEPRMVRTPWQEKPMPFAKAAEVGTEKVIREHATIGVIVSTDGSIGEISRRDYAEAEERVVKELKALGKPFAMVLNSAHPEDKESLALAYELEETYKVPVALVNCQTMGEEDISQILSLILCEFPVTQLRLDVPVWVHALEPGHTIRKTLLENFRSCAARVKTAGSVSSAARVFEENKFVEKAELGAMDYGTGAGSIRLELKQGLYYETISQLTGMEIRDDGQLIATLKALADCKKQYDRVAEALGDANEKGYGIVMPDVSELRLEEPEIIKQAGGYGVKLKASAQSIHMIRANIETEINPIVGSEQQSEELIKYVLREFEEDPQKIWESNMFGKSLYELMNEGLHTKLSNIPEDSRTRLSETLERIINEGSGGLICIIL